MITLPSGAERHVLRLEHAWDAHEIAEALVHCGQPDKGSLDEAPRSATSPKRPRSTEVHHLEDLYALQDYVGHHCDEEAEGPPDVATVLLGLPLQLAQTLSCVVQLALILPILIPRPEDLATGLIEAGCDALHALKLVLQLVPCLCQFVDLLALAFVLRSWAILAPSHASGIVRALQQLSACRLLCSCLQCRAVAHKLPLERLAALLN
mmetsp:Transcript_13755/g.32344  ORF Transcript_13755/g.32344 Transcript_13755/m.32344 type:complete len:208 (-) Transcript_13755:11-634(-)